MENEPEYPIEEYDDLIGEPPGVVTNTLGLSWQEYAFVKHFAYYSDLAGAAAVAGWSVEEAVDASYRPRVADAIKVCRKANVNRLTMSVENVCREYARIGFSDPRNYFDSRGDQIPIHKLSEDAAAALAGLEYSETEVNGAIKTRTYKYKITDKTKGLDAMGKALGMFTEKVELTGTDGGPLQVEYSANERARRVAFLLQKAYIAKKNGEITDV